MTLQERKLLNSKAWYAKNKVSSFTRMVKNLKRLRSVW